METMTDIFWQEYPGNEPERQRINGPCMLHGKFDCPDCCPELYDGNGVEDEDFDSMEEE